MLDIFLAFNVLLVQVGEILFEMLFNDMQPIVDYVWQHYKLLLSGRQRLCIRLVTDINDVGVAQLGEILVEPIVKNSAVGINAAHNNHHIDDIAGDGVVFDILKYDGIDNIDA